MKSLTVWRGHSTRPSLPAGTARKARGSLPRGRQSRLILQERKNRAFPTGNALLYISLSYVDFGRVRPAGRTLFFCYTPDVPSRISHRRNCVNLTQFLSTAARTPHAYFKSNRSWSDTPASAQERFSILWASWQYPPTPAGYAPIRHLSYQWY